MQKVPDCHNLLPEMPFLIWVSLFIPFSLPTYILSKGSFINTPMSNLAVASHFLAHPSFSPSCPFILTWKLPPGPFFLTQEKRGTRVKGRLPLFLPHPLPPLLPTTWSIVLKWPPILPLRPIVTDRRPVSSAIALWWCVLKQTRVDQSNFYVHQKMK